MTEATGTALSALPVEALTRKVLRERRIDESCTPQTWLAFLPGLAELDKREDGQRSTLIGLCFGFGFLGLFACIWLASKGLPVMLLVWLVVEVGLIIATVRLQGRDLSNQLREAVVPLLGVLNEEMDAAEPLHLQLDLRGRTIKDKLVRTDKATSTRYYVDPWMSGSGKLADGSLLSFQVIDRASLRSVSKRGSSGKTKTKTKARLSTLIDVTLRVRAKDYVQAEAAPVKGKPDAKLQVKDAGKRTVVRVRRVVKSRGAEGLLDVNEFLSTVARAYQAVSPRREEKHS